VALSLPAPAAVAVFGTLYGAAARVYLGVPLTLASTLLVYSGALQFAIVALLGAGATTLPLLLTAGVLNLRHLVLGAALRSRFESGPLGGLAAVEGLAGALFPVLFIGLASLAVRRRSHVVRALAAALLTAAVAVLLPDLRMIAPVVAGVVVALPGRD
jgi:branched chain amino acid efflux pump